MVPGRLNHFPSWMNGSNSSIRHRSALSSLLVRLLLVILMNLVPPSVWVWKKKKPMKPKESKLAVSPAGSSHWADVMRLGSTSVLEGSQIPPLDSWTSCLHPRVLEVLHDSFCLSIKNIESWLSCPIRKHTGSFHLSLAPVPYCC